MINRYSKPISAEFLNTYTPMPFREMMQAGQMAEQRYNTNMQMLGAAEASLQNLRGIPNTADFAEANQIVANAEDLVKRYLGENLLDPFVAGKFQREFRSIVDPKRAREIMESRAKWEQAQKAAQAMTLKGMYDPSYDIWDPARNREWSSAGGNIYTYTPQPVQDVDKWSDQVFSKLWQKATSKGAVYIDPITGRQFMTEGVGKEDIRNIINEDWKSLTSSVPLRQHMIKILKSQGYTEDQIRDVYENPNKYRDVYYDVLEGLGSKYLYEHYRPLSVGRQDQGQQLYTPSVPSLVTSYETRGVTKDLKNATDETAQDVVNETKDRKIEAHETILTSLSNNIISKEPELEKWFSDRGEMTNDERLTQIATFINDKRAEKGDGALTPEEVGFLNNYYSYKASLNDKINYNKQIEQARRKNADMIWNAYNDPTYTDGKESFVDEMKTDKGVERLVNLSNTFILRDPTTNHSSFYIAPEEKEAIKENLIKATAYYTPIGLITTDKTGEDIGQLKESKAKEIGAEVLNNVIDKNRIENFKKEDPAGYDNYIRNLGNAVKRIHRKAGDVHKTLASQGVFENVRSKAIDVKKDPVITLSALPDLIGTTSNSKINYATVGDSMFNTIKNHIGNTIQTNDVSIEELDDKYKNKIGKLLSDLKHGDRVLDPEYRDQNMRFKVKTDDLTGEAKLIVYLDTYKTAGQTDSGKVKFDYGSKVTIPIVIDDSEKNMPLLRAMFGAFGQKGVDNIINNIFSYPVIANEIKATDFYGGDDYTQKISKVVGNNKVYGYLSVNYDPTYDQFSVNYLEPGTDVVKTITTTHDLNEAVDKATLIKIGLMNNSLSAQ